MKVAFFVSEFPSLTETFIVNQIADLQQKGHQILIFAQSGSATSIVHSKIVDHHLLSVCTILDRLPKRRLGKAFLLFKTLLRNFNVKNINLILRFLMSSSASNRSVYELIHFIDKGDFDVVHAHFGINGIYVAQLQKMGLFKNSRFVTTFHGYDLVVENHAEKFYQELFNSCEIFTVNSTYSQTKLISLGAPSEKVIKLPVGVDVGFFSITENKKKIEKPFVILFVGRLIAFKAPDSVVDICAILKKRGIISFRTLLVGDGVLKSKLEEKIYCAHLEHDVLLLGPKSQSEIRDLMALADIFLFPGRNENGRAENQGLVLQEAQAMRLPVLISDAGGMKEGVLDGETGFVVSSGNLEGFADRIEMLANNTALRMRMGNLARQYVEQNFDIDLLNEKLLQIYEGVNKGR